MKLRPFIPILVGAMLPFALHRCGVPSDAGTMLTVIVLLVMVWCRHD